MKAEKFNNKGAESFNDNISNSMKWMQESTALFLEAQQKQMKFATDMYSNSLNTSFTNFSKGNFDSTFGATEKVTEMVQKNIESLSKIAEANVKTMMELTTQANSTLFSKEAIDQITETYGKNAEMIAAFNQNAFDALTKQSELSKNFVKPFAENMKHELEANTQKFNDMMKQTMSSFSNLTNPSFDANKNIFGDLAQQMQNVFSNNLKSWSTFMNNYNADGFMADPFEAASKKAEQKDAHTSKSKMQPAHV